MKKRLLCVLLAAVLLLGALTGCGGSAGSSGSSGVSNSGKPGVGSSENDKGGHMDNDPVAVMQERVNAVNSAINYTCVGIEETVEAGLLFYNLTRASPAPDETRDYKPDKPLDYYAAYRMVKDHTEGIVSEDTYVPLLKKAVDAEVVSSDVIETDDLYVYYYPNNIPSRYNGAYFNNFAGPAGCFGCCFVLVKNTDILYCFTVMETWYKADYYEVGNYSDLRYTDADAEYIFTAEFWKAFAQTAKFVGNADEDFKSDEYIDQYIKTMGRINRYGENEIKVKIPYIEEWYAGGSYGRDAIRDGFKKFVEAHGDYGFLVIDDFGQGEPTMFYDDVLYKYTGGGEVTPIHDFADTFAGLSEDWWMLMSTDADRTHLLFSAGAPYGDEIRVVDLKTFEVTDEVWDVYDTDTNEFTQGSVNGVDVDGETAEAKCREWFSVCNIHLLGRSIIEPINFDAAWSEYINRS